MKIAFRQVCVPLCGRFGPDEGGVAGYVDRIGTKYAAKWGVQMAEMNFQTRSKAPGPGKDGHRSELRRRPDAGPSAYALLRALRALRNPAFPAPLDLRLSKPLHSHLPPVPPPLTHYAFSCFYPCISTFWEGDASLS